MTRTRREARERSWLELAREVGGDHADPREFDVLVSTGEQKTIALLAMAMAVEYMIGRTSTL